MPVNHLLFFLTEVAEPEHGQHEVDIIHIADGQDGEEDNGNQGCRPKTTQGFEGDVSDEVAEEDALQEPYRIEEPEPTEVHQLGTRIVSGEHDKRIHDGESGKGGMTSWTNFFFTSSPKDRLSEEPKKYPHSSMNKGM